MNEKRLLESALYEIQNLRQRNKVLGAQVHVINVFAAAVGMRQTSGMAEDIAWHIQERLDEIKSAETEAQSLRPAPPGGE